MLLVPAMDDMYVHGAPPPLDHQKNPGNFFQVGLTKEGEGAAVVGGERER